MLATSLLLLASGAHTPEAPAEAPAEGPTLETSETWAELLAKPAPPKQSGGGISYSYASLSYQSGEGDSDAVEASAFFEVGDHFFIGGGYGTSSTSVGDYLIFDNFGNVIDVVESFLDVDVLSLGVGAHFEPSDTVSLFAQFQLGFVDIEQTFDPYFTSNLGDGNGTSLGIGARFRPVDMFEGFLQFSTTDFSLDTPGGGSSDLEYDTTSFGVRVYATDALALTVSRSSTDYDAGGDADVTAFGINYFF